MIRPTLRTPTTLRYAYVVVQCAPYYPHADAASSSILQVSWYGYEQGAAPAANLTALGDYYGRLLSWYTLGGFTDEYGAFHASGHFLDIQNYEVFNGACPPRARARQ